MKECLTKFWLTLNCVVLIAVADGSYYSIIAPGVIKSNRNYTVLINIYEAATEPAAIRVTIEGPHYEESHMTFVKPFESVQIVFKPPKLLAGDYKLIAEGVSGIRFRNESKIQAHGGAGPKIYIQTDRAFYKPGSLIQFRVVILDEHTRPLQIAEPIRVEILDGNKNRVKQFKDIRLLKGVYSGKLRLSEYPVPGYWQIKVYLSGKYDYTASTYVGINRYILPRYNVFIETENDFITEDSVIRALVYGKYSFDKYVEGNVTAKLVSIRKDIIIQQKEMPIKDKVMIEFPLDHVEDLKAHYSLKLQVEIEENHTGLKQSWSSVIMIRDQRYNIFVEQGSIQLAKHKRYGMTVKVQHWNSTAVNDKSTPVLMKHGSQEYEAFLDDNGSAFFELNDDGGDDFVFWFKNSTYTMPSYFWNRKANVEWSDTYCWLELKEDRPRLGVPLHIEVTSPEYIPYLIYTIMGHANIIQTEHIIVPRYQKSYTIEIIPSIEMIPSAYVYVHYIQNGHLRYEELRLNFPQEFENQISIDAPQQFKPGGEVTIGLKAQPESHVCLLAVDLSVYLFDRSYDLDKRKIMKHLAEDISTLPIRTITYPGRLSGLLTFTNANYEYIPDSKYASIGSATSASRSKIRSDFPETWIFQCIEISNNITEMSLNIPETANTWRLTAFSVNEVTGFGIVKEPTDIVALKPLSISLNLPYSVKLGEIISIPIIVQNNYNQTLDTEIIMNNAERQFYFINSVVFDPERGYEDQGRIKRMKLPAYSVERVTFVINPKREGELNINITATNSISSEAIVQKLKVEPEGLLQRRNKGMYIDLFHGETATARFELETPVDSVPNSEVVIALFLGSDSIVPALKHLNNLVTLPTGCGEQNMANLASNVLILQYLKLTGNYYLEKDLVGKIKSSVEISYQQQLSYRHSKGGYSIFGHQQEEKDSSTWLTAYVIRYLIKASKYVNIEGAIINSGLDYLSKAQMDDGSFLPSGYLLYPYQGNQFGFTAFVLMTFLEDQIIAMRYQKPIEKGLQFLANNLVHVQDIYPLSIMAVALQMAHNSNVQIILDKLKLHRRQLPHLMWWSEDDQNPQKDIEITAYVLMALLESTNDRDDDLRILKWLVEQRNERGGFKSTYDTVLGLEAMVKYTKKYNNFGRENLNIDYSAKAYDGSIVKSGEFRMDTSNEIIWKMEEFPKSTRSIDIHATGFGHSLLQLTYHYRTVPKETFEYFQLQTEAKMLNKIQMLVEICFSYQPTNRSSSPSVDNTSTDMVIMEVNLPSGFLTTDENRSDLAKSEPIIQRLESINSDSVIIMYFEKLSINVRYCLKIVADKMFDVIAHKPAAVVIYDYYNSSRLDRVFYSCGMPIVGDGTMDIR